MTARSRSIGITDYAQSQLGDVVYVELPEIGRHIDQGKEAAVVESVKAASDVYAPVSGEVVEVNEALAGDPAKVNADPMGEGWFMKLRLADPKQLDELMDEAAYGRFVEESAIMRYLPLTAADRNAMLKTIGVPSIDALFADIPAAARLDGLLDLPRAQGELEVERAIGRMAARNVSAGSVPFFVGGGAYRHHIPAAVDHLIQRGEFLTSYTPYQPEISQGTLQYLFEFQTQVALLTGMEVANASLYDGATACAEAVMMANRVTGRKRAVLSGGLHPHYRDVCATYARFVGFELAAADPNPGETENLADLIDGGTSCVVVQNPDFWGELRDWSALGEACHAKGALLVVVVTEIVSLGAVRSPGEMGADIVAAEGQSLGNALELWRPISRSLCNPRQIRAPNAGPARRSNC